MSNLFRLYVIYDHPSDYPNDYVARCHYENLEIKVGSQDEVALVSKNVDALRKLLEEMGLVKIERFDNDDSVILETWA